MGILALVPPLTGKPARAALLLGATLLAGLPRLCADQALTAALPPGGRFSVVERSDLRRYENGRFVGLAYAEIKGLYRWEVQGQVQRVEGTLYVLEGLMHRGVSVARRIEESVPVSYAVLPDGSWETAGDPVYPLTRGVPAVPLRALLPGEAWRSPGLRILRPLPGERPVSVRFVSDYRYEGEKELEGGRAGLVSARYALRYLKARDPWADGPVVSATGSHDLRIRLNPGTGVISFIQDKLEEECRLEDGRSVGYKGFSLTWVRPTVPLNQEETVKTIAETLLRSGGRDLEVARTPEGVVLSVNRIHFVADEAVVLPEDLPRLASVAEALARVPERSFRVIGHTARVGTGESQQELSVRRAKAVVDYLVSRGLSADRFLYEGRGGTQPAASNDTEEGRAANRRVEIVILED